jgi:hypothetical protein
MNEWKGSSYWNRWFWNGISYKSSFKRGI